MGYYGDRIAGLVYRRSYNGNYVYIFSWPDCFGRGPLAPMSCRSLFSPRPRSFLLQRKYLIIEESILLSNVTRRALESNQSLDVGNKATTATPKEKKKEIMGQPEREKEYREVFHLFLLAINIISIDSGARTIKGTPENRPCYIQCVRVHSAPIGSSGCCCRSQKAQYKIIIIYIKEFKLSWPILYPTTPFSTKLIYTHV